MRYSIIIPVYNAEAFLPRCLDSVLRQGLTEDSYEVLLVDDGSTDGSVSVCQGYCDRHAVFRLLCQPNSGVSAARNRGIASARGKYVLFVDADDYLLDGGLSAALSCLDTRDDVDVVSYVSSYDFWPVRPIDGRIALDGTGHDLIMQRGIVSFCWLFAYRKAFLDRHGIRFSPYIVGEDQLFTASVLLAKPRLVASNADIYRYVVHEGSATTGRSATHARRCVDDYLSSYADIVALLERHGIADRPELYRKCVDELNFKKMFGFSRMLTSRYGRNDFRRVKVRCKELGFLPVLPVPRSSIKARLKAWLMNAAMHGYVSYRCAAWCFNAIVEPYVLRRIRTRL